MDAIAVEHLYKRFGTFEAVKDVSFSVKQGEVFGFLGPNGAGKTTTINILCTLLSSSSGSATVDGFDLRSSKNDVRKSIGLVFQDSTLDEYLTAEQNLLFHAYAYAIPKAVYRPRMDELLEMLSLSARRKDRIRTFSGGMKRRLEIVRGLLHHPKVLFLDEPTLGLDPQTRNTIWQYLQSLRDKEGITIFLTTHYMDEAEYCNRIGIIDHGSIVALDTPEHLKDTVGGDVVSVQAANMEALSKEISSRYQLTTSLQNGAVTFSVQDGEHFLPRLMRDTGQEITSIALRRPTLDDVFLKITGRDIRNQHADPYAAMKQRRGFASR